MHGPHPPQVYPAPPPHLTPPHTPHQPYAGLPVHAWIENPCETIDVNNREFLKNHITTCTRSFVTMRLTISVNPAISLSG